MWTLGHCFVIAGTSVLQIINASDLVRDMGWNETTVERNGDAAARQNCQEWNGGA
jgi:hypothetical protein